MMTFWTRSIKAHSKLALTAVVISPLIMGGLSECDGFGKQTVITKVVCPRMREYSLTTQKKAAAELRAVQGQIPTVLMIFRDTKALRDSIRECIADQEAAAAKASKR